VQHTQKLESLGVLAGGIAHDFNNLLMGILGNVEMSLESARGDSSLFEELTEIQKAARHAADLCRQMLAYSGRGQFVTESLSLSDVVGDIPSLLEASISKSCSLQYELREDLPPVLADPVQMRQILLNLVTNASEAIGGRGGSVKVSTAVRNCEPKFFERFFLDDQLNPGLYVVLKVKDTGSGMDADTLEKIFDPFFTTKFTGRGLGLAAVLGIIRGHKGTIHVNSTPGEGTTFSLYFPASQRIIQAVDPDEPGKVNWCGGGTVLLVDDEPTVRVVGQRMLERAGFEVITTEDGVVGVERLREHSADIVCVLLDLTMPNMDGEETYREMRKIRSDLPVIVSRGYDEEDVIGRFGTGPKLVFLQKPYEKSALVSKIYELLSLEDPVHA
jgi:CheY-like chemotaxis protein